MLGIRSNDIREDLLKVRHLVLDKCIDICKASETAALHSNTLVPDNVNRVLDGKQRDDTKECKFCSFIHPMKKEKYPAWGNVCNRCGKMNHPESQFHETFRKSATLGRHSSQGRKQYERLFTFTRWMNLPPPVLMLIIGWLHRGDKVIKGTDTISVQRYNHTCCLMGSMLRNI